MQPWTTETELTAISMEASATTAPDGHAATLPASLSVASLTKRFGGLVAVNDVSFEVRRGSITALIGPNGAGKTTLFNLIAGALKPNNGRVRFEGHDVTGRRPDQIAAAGIARTFQNVQLFSHMNALENVVAARRMRVPRRRESLRVSRRRRAIEDSMQLLQRTGLEGKETRMPGELPYGDQRRLEIARALALEPRLLILDEPTAGMIALEARVLMDLMRGLRDEGTTVLLIEHNMDVVMQVSDWIVALNFGSKIAEGTPESIRSHPDVVEAYLGRED
jgi:branched-chain amino acid transport system ATP-binding protein